jgi:hypothetical protein
MTEGIEAVYLEAHNWGNSANFFQKLGYTMEFETDHNSGQPKTRSHSKGSTSSPRSRRPIGVQGK